MPSTYTVNLGIEKPATGEQSGTWGDTTNVNFDILDQAVNGAARVTLTSAGSSGSPNTLAITNGATSDGRNKWVEFYSSSDLGGNVFVQLDPNDAEKIVFVRNSLGGSQPVILFQGTYDAGRDLEVPAGMDMVVKFDGGGATATTTNVFQQLRTEALNIAGDGATVTGIKDEDDMSSNSPTKLATQQSIKAYVDAQVGTVDTLAEVLANGNTTGGTDISVNGTDDIVFGDDNKAIFGAGSDLQIYHDGSHSIIEDAGTGAIKVKVGDFRVENASGNNLIKGVGDVATLHNAGNEKLATTSTGIDVTGQVDVNSAARIDSSGIVKAANGTAAAPTHAFLNDPDNGMYRNTTNTIGFATAGTDALIIDSSQRVLIGTDTARTDFFNTSATGSLQVEGTTANTASASIVRNSNDDNGPQFILGKSNGTSVGSDTIVTDDALLGRISYQGADGAELVEGARIEGKVDGTPGANDMPGKIVFSTTADGSSSPSNRMTIANNGNIAIGTAADPSVRLDLKYSEATNYGIKVTNTNTTITAKSGITMPVSNGTGGGAIYVDSAVSSGNGNTYDMHLETFQGASNIIFEPTGTEAMRIDSSQRVLIGGQSDTLTVGGIAALLQVENTGGSAAISIARHTASVNSGYLNFGKSRGADATIVQENDNTGFIQWSGADGTDINSYTAYISSAVDGTPGSNDMPGRLVFWTTADGASSPTERMQIDNAGSVSIGTVGTSSQAKVQINGGADGSGILTGRTDGGNGNNERFVITGFADGGGANYGGGIGFETRDTVNVFHEAMRIDSSQRVLIGDGISSRGSNLNLQVEGTGFAGASASFTRNSNDASPPALRMTKSRSGSTGGVTVVQENDSLGQLQYQGTDGSTAYTAAAISVEVDDSPGSTDMPGRLVFSTTSNGGTSPTERMRIDSTGRTFVGDLSYIGTATTNSVFEAHGGSVVFGSGDSSNNQGYRTFVKFLQVNNSSGLPTSATLELAGMTSEFYCKITVVGVNPYSGSNGFTYINESTGYAGGNFSVISANEYGAGTGISFGTATLVNTSGALYSIQIPVTSSYTGYRFVVTAEIIGVSPQNDPRFTYS